MGNLPSDCPLPISSSHLSEMQRHGNERITEKTVLIPSCPLFMKCEAAEYLLCYMALYKVSGDKSGRVKAPREPDLGGGVVSAGRPEDTGQGRGQGWGARGGGRKFRQRAQVSQKQGVNAEAYFCLGGVAGNLLSEPDQGQVKKTQGRRRQTTEGTRRGEPWPWLGGGGGGARGW